MVRAPQKLLVEQLFFCSVGVVKTLFEMHTHGFVHGDIRVENIVFTKDSGYLIDFDFVGHHGKTRYPQGYNIDVPGRHEGAFAGALMMFVHDRFSLSKIMEECMHSKHTAKVTQITEKLNNVECSLGDITPLF